MENSFLGFSVIIIYRNEKENLNNLVNSLKSIIYPIEKYEVILLDDASSDDGCEYLKSINLPANYRLIKNIEHLGKKKSIAKAIQLAKNEYFAFTDADCVVPEKWLITFNKYFNSGNSFLIGYSPFNQLETCLNKIICYDNFRNTFLTTLLYSFGLPYNAFGRNLAYTKKLYSTLKGFDSIDTTLSGDDDLLVQKGLIAKAKIIIVKDRDSLVFTYAKTRLKDYIKQRTRHTKASHLYANKIKFLLACWHSLNILAILSLIFVYFSISFIFPFIIKAFFDIFVLKNFENKLNYKFSLITLIPLEVTYNFFLVLFFVYSIIKKDVW